MKILITGKNSYIGEHIKSHLKSFGYYVNEVDTVSDEWISADFSQYDSIVHVAAIVHDDAKQADDELFKKVNTDLPVKIAKKAKKSGVGNFIFISTMAVFGVGKTLNEKISVINKDTKENPKDLYGVSKFNAEKQLQSLNDGDFKIAIVRPPNVYGPNCKGNYIYLFNKIAKLMFICPYAYENVRQSMLYIDNLSELIRLIIDNNSAGLFLPQDDWIPSTVELISNIRKFNGKKFRKSKLLGRLLLLLKRTSIVNKIYGGVQYDIKASACFDNKYQIVSFSKGLEITYNELIKNIE